MRGLVFLLKGIIGELHVYKEILVVEIHQYRENGVNIVCRIIFDTKGFGDGVDSLDEGCLFLPSFLQVL